MCEFEIHGKFETARLMDTSGAMASSAKQAVRGDGTHPVENGSRLASNCARLK